MPSNPEVRIKEGERINFHVDATGHPFYIKTTNTTGTGDLVSGVTNNGATDGSVTWTPPGGSAGTYYYKCGNHAAMGGVITVVGTPVPPGYIVNLTASDNNDYTLSGDDRNGAVSGDDVDVTIKEGDRINFIVDASGHPLYLKTQAGSGTGNQIGGVVNQGDDDGNVYWTAPAGSAGTYYYQCGNHAAMSGKLIVTGNSQGGNPTYTGEQSNGGPVSEHCYSLSPSGNLCVRRAGPYFLGSVPIKFSKLRQYFKEIYPVDDTVSVSASELRRVTNVLERNAIVPDSTENENIASVTEFNWKCSQFRGSVKRYWAHQTGTVSQFDMGRYSGGAGIDWCDMGNGGRDSINSTTGNHPKNIQKHVYIKGICYSSSSGTLGARSDRGNGKDKVPAARLIPSEPNNNVVPANNVRIYVENNAAIYGSAGIGGYSSTGGYESGAPAKSIPGKDGGTALKIQHTGDSKTDIYIQQTAKIWGGGGSGEQGEMGDLEGTSWEDMRGTCSRIYSANSGANCGDAPSCDAGDTLVDTWTGSPCIDPNTGLPSGNQQFGTCEEVTPSNLPVQGIGGAGGDGAGWGFAVYAGGGPQDKQNGETGTTPSPAEIMCPTCPAGTVYRRDGECSGPGGVGGDGGTWGADGQPTSPIDQAPLQDAGKGGAAICGLNPSNQQKNWEVGGYINDNTLKGKYTGDCVGGGAPIPPVPGAPDITMDNTQHYVRFGDDGDGTGKYGSSAASNLIVTAPAGEKVTFDLLHRYDDDKGIDNLALRGFEVYGNSYGLPFEYWALCDGTNADPNPKTLAMHNLGIWSHFMREFAIFPVDNDNQNYPTNTRAGQEAVTGYFQFGLSQFEVRRDCYILAQSDNEAIIYFRDYVSDPYVNPDADFTDREIARIAPNSNPAIDHYCANIDASIWQDQWTKNGKYQQVVVAKITNSAWPAGQEPVPGANQDWDYNPGGVAFIIKPGTAPTLNNMSIAELTSKVDNRLFSYSGYNDRDQYYAESRIIDTVGDGVRLRGSTSKRFQLFAGIYPITWIGLNPRNGSGDPNASRISQNNPPMRLELLDDGGSDVNQSVEILDPTVSNTVELDKPDPDIPSTNLYGGLTITWSVTGDYDVLTGSVTPSNASFPFPGTASGSVEVFPVETTVYTVTASYKGAADVESITIL
tara:strand:+ start:219 stop:3677 length:3459 start_codon:yes stop_codon:yes gene_type:complete